MINFSPFLPLLKLSLILTFLTTLRGEIPEQEIYSLPVFKRQRAISVQQGFLAEIREPLEGLSTIEKLNISRNGFQSTPDSKILSFEECNVTTPFVELIKSGDQVELPSHIFKPKPKILTTYQQVLEDEYSIIDLVQIQNLVLIMTNSGTLVQIPLQTIAENNSSFKSVSKQMKQYHLNRSLEGGIFSQNLQKNRLFFISDSLQVEVTFTTGKSSDSSQEVMKLEVTAVSINLPDSRILEVFWLPNLTLALLTKNNIIFYRQKDSEFKKIGLFDCNRAVKKYFGLTLQETETTFGSCNSAIYSEELDQLLIVDHVNGIWFAQTSLQQDTFTVDGLELEIVDVFINKGCSSIHITPKTPKDKHLVLLLVCHQGLIELRLEIAKADQKHSRITNLEKNRLNGMSIDQVEIDTLSNSQIVILQNQAYLRALYGGSEVPVKINEYLERIFVQKEAFVGLTRSSIEAGMVKVHNPKIMCLFNETHSETEQTLNIEYLSECNSTVIDSHFAIESADYKDLQLCRYREEVPIKVWSKVQVQRELLLALGIVVVLAVCSMGCWMYQKGKISQMASLKEGTQELELDADEE